MQCVETTSLITHCFVNQFRVYDCCFSDNYDVCTSNGVVFFTQKVSIVFNGWSESQCVRCRLSSHKCVVFKRHVRDDLSNAIRSRLQIVCIENMSLNSKETKGVGEWVHALTCTYTRELVNSARFFLPSGTCLFCWLLHCCYEPLTVEESDV